MENANNDNKQEPQKAIIISRKSKRNREKKKKIQKQENKHGKAEGTEKTDKNTCNMKQAERRL